MYLYLIGVIYTDMIKVKEKYPVIVTILLYQNDEINKLA